jgi:lipopolysaccharide export system protein LptA
MSDRIERLRGWLLGSAVFLMLTIAAFVGSARYLRHLHLKLPARLGIDVTAGADEWTATRKVGNRALFFIQAAKQIQYKNGKMALHDVCMELYGSKGDREDLISGDDFEYDQEAGLVRALGAVHIDLKAAQTAGGKVAARPAGTACAELKAGTEASQVPGSKVLHVTTSGLVYMEKLGVAATGAPIEFKIDAMTGHATGADYNSDTGMLLLHSAVSMSGPAGGRPVQLTAASAEFDNRSQQAHLTQAKYESLGRAAEAQQATLYTRPDGSVERVDAQGDVTVHANGATMNSQQAEVALNALSQPKTVLLQGGVRYSSDAPLRQVRGQADRGTIAFDAQAKPQPQHAVFTGGVHMTERTRATEAAREPWTTRDLTAAKFEADLAPAGEGRSELRDAEATGNARLVEVNLGSLASAAGEGTTELSADDLKAHLFATADAKQPPQLETLAGRGHTLVHQVAADGVEQISSGDTLDAKFRPENARGSATKAGDARGAKIAAADGKQSQPGPRIEDTLLSAVQQGHFAMTRRVPAKSGAQQGNNPCGETGPPANAQEDVEHGSAERATYDGDLRRLTLTGSARVTDAGCTLWANQVAMDRATGDAQAEGAVKVDYVQQASAQQGTPSEPTHILADRAGLEYATGVATFYGKPARLWQGASQVQAPAIELAQAQKRLIARSETSTGWSSGTQAAQVHTVLVRAASDQSTAGVGAGKSGACAVTPASGAGPAKTKAGSGLPAADVVRIASGGLIYSGILGQADFTGGFRADTVDATIQASQATAYLEKKPSSEGATGVGPAGGQAGGGQTGAVPSLGGTLDRVVASGHVEVEQPGLHASGEHLIYTEADELAVLTGDGKTLAKAVDAQGNTTTAAELRFSSCDGGGRVEALGAPGQQVRTNAQVGGEGKNRQERH